MVSDVERVRSNNEILVNRDWNCSGMTADNTSERTFLQCGVSTAIERWGLVYQEVGKIRW